MRVIDEFFDWVQGDDAARQIISRLRVFRLLLFKEPVARNDINQPFRRGEEGPRSSYGKEIAEAIPAIVQLLIRHPRRPVDAHLNG
jgi:hypothetical protein